MSKKVSKSNAAKSTMPAAKRAPINVAASPRERRNGITQPAEGTLCRKVWDVLDGLRAKGGDTTFTTIREMLKDEKMADATVRTQTQRWREYNGFRGRAVGGAQDAK